MDYLASRLIKHWKLQKNKKYTKPPWPPPLFLYNSKNTCVTLSSARKSIAKDDVIQGYPIFNKIYAIGAYRLPASLYASQSRNTPRETPATGFFKIKVKRFLICNFCLKLFLKQLTYLSNNYSYSCYMAFEWFF